jgi:hypothetical protein
VTNVLAKQQKSPKITKNHQKSPKIAKNISPLKIFSPGIMFPLNY